MNLLNQARRTSWLCCCVLVVSMPLGAMAQGDDKSSGSSVADHCVKDKDHAACLKYYRASCIAKDSSACQNYAHELEMDCGTTPQNASLATLQNHLACMRKAQCWNDRALGLNRLKSVCQQNPESDECKQVKTTFSLVTPAACDAKSSAGSL